jgi:DNA ligase-associated metallophosphoesterase
MLILSDVHLGKARHFRANGIAVPLSSEQSNTTRIKKLIDACRPKRVLILGDLFHSSYNQEVSKFKMFLNKFPSISFELVIGNHDVLGLATYQELNLIIHENSFIEGPFIFTHEPLLVPNETYYNLSGHIHPSVVLKGKGRVKQRFACFYFGQKQGLFPAFGSFTGTAEIQPKKRDQVFIIAGQNILQV